MIIISGIVSLYYTVIFAWCIMYLIFSITNELPWTTCDTEWATESKYKIINLLNGFQVLIFMMYLIVFFNKYYFDTFKTLRSSFSKKERFYSIVVCTWLQIATPSKRQTCVTRSPGRCTTKMFVIMPLCLLGGTSAYWPRMSQDILLLRTSSSEETYLIKQNSDNHQKFKILQVSAIYINQFLC